MSDRNTADVIIIGAGIMGLCAALQVSQRAHYSSEDGQWSEGLISAARTVAVATHSLCQAANSLVQGHSSEEMLISAAKQVSRPGGGAARPGGVGL